MVRDTDVLLQELDRRIDALEADLKKLRSAREVVRTLETADETPVRAKPTKLVEAIVLALREIGPAGSGDIITWLRKNWNPDVNPGSTRSTLSGCKGRKFDNDGKKWRLLEK